MALGGPRIRQRIIEYVTGEGQYIDGVLDSASPTGPWNFVVPPDVTFIEVDGCGGGGGGGAGGTATGNTSCGGGGGGGGAAIALGFRLYVEPGATYSVSIGSGGTAGVVGGAQPSAGGITSISSASGVSFPWAGAGVGDNPGLYIRGGGAGVNGSGANGTFGAGGAGGAAANGLAGGAGGASSAAAGGAGVPDFGQFPAYSVSPAGGGGAGHTTAATAGGNGGNNGVVSGLNNAPVAFSSGAIDLTNSTRGTGNSGGAVSYGGGGAGGWCPFGGMSVAGNGNIAAVAGNGYGVGGSGGGGNAAGAAGMPGVLILTYWSAD
jgi:hypothetical protein